MISLTAPMPLAEVAPWMRRQLARLRRPVRSELRSELVRPRGVVAVLALEAGRPVGWATARRCEGRVLLACWVARAHRRQGLGRRLAAAVARAGLARWPGRGLLAYALDEAGRRLYARLGLRLEGG